MTSLAAAALLALAGCAEARRVIGEYEVVESAEVATAPYPALVDMPSPRALREDAPDPAEGDAAVRELQSEAAVQQAEAERLSAPVFAVEPLRRAAEETRAGR